MVIVDHALEECAVSGRPIRIGLVGAGFMARAIARQIVRGVPGIRLVGVASRRPDRAVEVWRAAGVDEVSRFVRSIGLQPLVWGNDLAAGARIDGSGCFVTYGQCDNASTLAAEGLLPMGVAEGCLLVRDVGRREVLRYDDVVLPPDRLVDRPRPADDRADCTDVPMTDTTDCRTTRGKT